MRGGRRTELRFGDDLRGARGVAIELAIRVLIRSKRRAIKRDTGKSASCTRVTQNLRAHISVGISRSGTSLRSGRGGYVCSQLHLRAQQAACAAVVHDEKDEVSCFAAN